MIRFLAVAIFLSSFSSCAWAQTPPPAGTPQRPTTAIKPVVKKSTPKAKPGAKSAMPAETGPCNIGVISAIGDEFTVQHIGLTVFGNEEMKAPIEAWGLDDLVVARVRAAAPGMIVKKITYPKGAFDEGKGKFLFNNPAENLANKVRQVAGGSNCERYIVATKSTASLGGTNQTITGMGVTKNWATRSRVGVLAAFFHLTVFDGHTFVAHRSPYANLGEVLKRLTGLNSKGSALQEVNQLDFPQTPDQATNNALLRDGTSNLLTKRLDDVLPAFLKQQE